MSKLSDAIFAADLDLKEQVVDVPEWGGIKLKVREPIAEYRAELAQRFVEAGEDASGIKLKELYPALLIACIVDPETDAPVFTEDDMGRLNQKEGRIIDRLARACVEVAGLDDSEVDAGKDDSSPSPIDGPSTDSLST